MKHLTIRNVPAPLSKALDRETRRTGESLNQTVKQLLERALGLSGVPYDNGLAGLAGGWTEAEAAQFKKDTEQFERIDPEQWR